jgi:hypothetical protein
MDQGQIWTRSLLSEEGDDAALHDVRRVLTSLAPTGHDLPAQVSASMLLSQCILLNVPWLLRQLLLQLSMLVEIG